MPAKIYTASWRTYFGPGRIGISRGNPRGVAGGYRTYKKLAPSADILHNTADVHEYRERFFTEILGNLDPQEVLKDIAKLSEGRPAYLMCFEKPPFTETNFCHRRMVADWLAVEAGVVVEEWSGLAESNSEEQGVLEL